MDLQDILSPAAIRTSEKATSKKKLLQDLGQHCAELYGLNTEQVYQALQDRESLGPTAMGHGVAIPHARLAALTEVRGFFVRLAKPIDFDSVDRQPVDLVFVLLAPENAGAAHLKALARVSRALRDASICAKLRAQDADAALIYDILTGNEASKAA